MINMDLLKTLTLSGLYRKINDESDALTNALNARKQALLQLVTILTYMH